MGLRALVLAASLGVAPPWGAWEAPLDRGHPGVGRFWDVATGIELEAAGVLERAAAAELVLVGERHDHPDHHRLQAWLLAGLGRRPAVAFEAVTPDQAPALEATLARGARDLDALAVALDWEGRGWPAWSLYAPVFAAALEHGRAILPANLSRAELVGLRERGLDALPAEWVRRFGLREELAPELRDALVREIREAHCGHAPEEWLPRMVEIQRARDARMAEVLLDATAGGAPAVLFAGNGHVRADRGAPAQLRRARPAARVFTLAPLEVPPDAVRLPHDLGDTPYDVVWITPRLDDEDPCRRHGGALRRLERHSDP